MNVPEEAERRRGRRLLPACLLICIAVAAVAVIGVPGHDVPRASGVSGDPELVAQTDDSPPLKSITLFGASPGEAAGEVWGLAPSSGGSTLVRYTSGEGWTVGAPLQNAEGEPLANFSLDTPEAFRLKSPSPLAAQTTTGGAGAMLGNVGSGASGRQAVLVREPGGPYKEVAVPEGPEGLESGEKLFGINPQPLLAVVDEAGGQAGVFVVPDSPLQETVVHWNGEHWTREPVEPSGAPSQFEVLGISASSPANAWLLARTGGTSGPLSLYHRRAGGEVPSWVPVTTQPGGEAGEPLQLFSEQLGEPTQDQAQLLTASGSGLWINARLSGSLATVTGFFASESEAAGSFSGAWCYPTAASSPTQVTECEAHPLVSPLPGGYSRSFAWTEGGGFGERILTGLPDGQFLRFADGEFHVVNTLGSDVENNPGETFGAAFDTSSEGWLGKRLMPVHITTADAAAVNRLASWPVPFRYALTALAPQPGAAIGATSSEALAVGDHGEIARFHPGQGWFPETLPGPGGKRQTPRLRAVAWPTPGRAFAVGDSKEGAGQMWLWRGETGLWEKDPAMPPSFRGNLLGIAFDPANSSRGYAIGQQGVLLSYGKSWTQEEEAAIPEAARGANFTSIAFAGSEAIVAWRKLVQVGRSEYVGGLIENNGNGWHEDASASALLGTAAVPWAVGGLPDGGAAFTARNPAGGATVYERSSPSSEWQGYTYPGGLAPGSLALFREGSALRAIGVASEPDTISVEQESAPPAGAPPLLVDPYPLTANAERGVLRQTATGWSDEEHELNDAREPPGDYFFWDTPKVADPVSAVIVDPTGAHGWAVGGYVNSKRALLDTADVYRYPNEGTKPPGIGTKLETTGSTATSIAVGGGSGCAAPCVTRADTGIGPVVWTRSAIREAEEIGTIGTFLYTGPGVTTGRTSGPRLIPVPWQSEENFYASRTAGSSPMVCPVPSQTDREGTGEGTESFFQNAFAPTGTICGTTFSHGASYSFLTPKPKNPVPGELPVRVIVLDTSLLQGNQLTLPEEEVSWLREELDNAGGRAIVVGSANLAQENGEGRAAARELVQTIEAGGALAYFFDSPEQNVQLPLSSANKVKEYGSGTLGYVNASAEEQSSFLGQSGFLVAEVSNTRNSKGVYEVNVKLVPNVEELAIEAEQGTLLRRSQVAAFAGLARRPRSGNRSRSTESEGETSPYIAIPSNCVGTLCGEAIEPEYEFHSENSEYGEFVRRNFSSAQPNAVLQDKEGKPISQEAEGGKDGLFCAFNATPAGKPVNVTLKVANLLYTLPITIQAGSVRQPCGTVKLKNPKKEVAVSSPPPPAEGEPAKESPPPTSLSLTPPAPVAAHAPASHPAPLHQFVPQPAAVSFLPAFLPVPLPTPARPTPPSGTSPVTSPVEAAQKEDEEEAAPESVDAAASAYHPSEHETPPAYLLGLVVLAAFAGASLRGRRRPGRGIRVAPATVNASRAQQRFEREQRPPF